MVMGAHAWVLGSRLDMHTCAVAGSSDLEKVHVATILWAANSLM